MKKNLLFIFCVSLSFWICQTQMTFASTIHRTSFELSTSNDTDKVDTACCREKVPRCCQRSRQCMRCHAQEDSLKEVSHNLIIYYDQSVGKKPLLKAVKAYGSEILYIYNNFNAIAITVPAQKSLKEAKDYFEKVRGVLSVNEDRIYHLTE